MSHKVGLWLGWCPYKKDTKTPSLSLCQVRTHWEGSQLSESQEEFCSQQKPYWPELCSWTCQPPELWVVNMYFLCSSFFFTSNSEKSSCLVYSTYKIPFTFLNFSSFLPYFRPLCYHNSFQIGFSASNLNMPQFLLQNGPRISFLTFQKIGQWFLDIYTLRIKSSNYLMD